MPKRSRSLKSVIANLSPETFSATIEKDKIEAQKLIDLGNNYMNSYVSGHYPLVQEGNNVRFSDNDTVFKPSVYLGQAVYGKFSYKLKEIDKKLVEGDGEFSANAFTVSIIKNNFADKFNAAFRLAKFNSSVPYMVSVFQNWGVGFFIRDYQPQQHSQLIQEIVDNSLHKEIRYYSFSHEGMIIDLDFSDNNAGIVYRIINGTSGTKALSIVPIIRVKHKSSEIVLTIPTQQIKRKHLSKKDEALDFILTSLSELRSFNLESKLIELDINDFWKTCEIAQKLLKNLDPTHYQTFKARNRYETNVMSVLYDGLNSDSKGFKANLVPILQKVLELIYSV